jgi:O-antigen/teichoic acid export membrane protein
LITAFYGKDFSGGALVISIVAAAAVFSSLSDALSQVILSANRVWTNFLTDFFWAAAMVLLSRLWIPGHLAQGMACASLASYAAVVVWQASVVWWLLARMKTGAPA